MSSLNPIDPFDLPEDREFLEAIQTVLRIDREYDLPRRVRASFDATAPANAVQLEDALKVLYQVFGTHRPIPIELTKNGNAGMDATTETWYSEARR